MKRVFALSCGVMLIAALLCVDAVRQNRLRTTLLSSYADALPNDPALHHYAQLLATAAYTQHCAGCHGAALQGDQRRGVPDLRSGVWLYDFGRVSDIERTILYGIRSGHAKGRNTTDMPAMGISHRLTNAEIADVAAYVMSLSHTGQNTDSATRGKAIYLGKGECFDCHGADATGNIDWGVPSLTEGARLYGSSMQDITISIHDGRHGMCPAWAGVLDPASIRALAIMLHNAAGGKPQA